MRLIMSVACVLFFAASAHAQLSVHPPVKEPIRPYQYAQSYKNTLIAYNAVTLDITLSGMLHPGLTLSRTNAVQWMITGTPIDNGSVVGTTTNITYTATDASGVQITGIWQLKRSR